MGHLVRAVTFLRGVRQLTAGRQQEIKCPDLTLLLPPVPSLVEPDQKPGQSRLDDAIRKGQHCRAPSMAGGGGGGGDLEGQQNLPDTVPSSGSNSDQQTSERADYACS